MRVQAGVYRVDITPPVGISMCGYFARNGVSQGVERPLTATCLVLAAGSHKIAILACDLMAVFNGRHEVDFARQQIAAAIGTTAESVLINTSHTHCGPTTSQGYSWESGEQHHTQAIYTFNLWKLLVGCASAANQRLQPARLGTATGSVRIGINRRELDPETGKVFLGENPDGPVDPTVCVIRVDDLGGRPLAIVFSHGCHTVTMGPKFLQLSPDYPGPARELIEHATGATAIFLQASGGDINPITGIGATEDDSADMTRIGHMLGAEVIQTAMQIRTHQKRGERMIFASLTRNSVYPWIPVDDQDIALGAAAEVVALPLYDPPSLEDARAILAHRTKLLEEARGEGRPAHQLAFFFRFRDWAELLVDKVKTGNSKLTLEVNLQALRIGDLGIAAAAGETLTELGLRTRAASPFPQTVLLGYSNGCVGYIPNAECYPKEGWSPWETYLVPDMLCQSYKHPMHFRPEAGQLLVDRCTALLAALHRRT